MGGENEIMKVLKTIPEIGEEIRKRWKKYEDFPRYKGNLYRGKEGALEEVLKFYFVLQDLNFHPNAIKRILARALDVTKTNIEDVIDKVIDEWVENKDEWDLSDSWSETFVIDIASFLRNAHARNYEIPLLKQRAKKERFLRRKEYPIERIKELREQGLSIRKIAKKLDVPKSTIHDILKKKD